MGGPVVKRGMVPGYGFTYIHVHMKGVVWGKELKEEWFLVWGIIHMEM